MALLSATLFKTDGSETQLGWPEAPDITELQSLLNGYVESAHTWWTPPDAGYVMKCEVLYDEEGRLKHLEANITASAILGYRVCGPVLIFHGQPMLEETKNAEEKEEGSQP